jgi:hypothetical protein
MSSYLMVELSVPKTPGNRNAVADFYSAITWHSWQDSEDADLVYVAPSYIGTPVMGYWLTTNQEKCRVFQEVATLEPKSFFENTHCLTLPSVTETVFVLEDKEIITRIWTQAEQIILHEHTVMNPMEHQSKYPATMGFRFRDPFGNRIRVTTDPGYEISRRYRELT